MVDNFIEKSKWTLKRGEGALVCLYDNIVTLKDKDRVIPVKYL